MALYNGYVSLLCNEPTVKVLTPAHNVGNSSSPSNVATKDFDDHHININTFNQHPEKYTKVEIKCQHRHCYAWILKVENEESIRNMLLRKNHVVTIKN